MIMKKFLNYPYLSILAVSFLMAGCAWKLGYIDLNTTAAFLETAPEDVFEETPSDLSEDAVSDSSSDEETVAEDVPEDQELTTPETPVFFEADRTYFDDALFIGDSRTVGLYEYGDLGSAIALADTGMSVYKVFKQTFTLNTGERLTLEEILTQKQFGKIYIMLGINELGYDFDQTVRRYADMVTTVESFQPDSLIFLQANLHITEKKSSSSPIYNNENINRFNLEVEKMTDSQKRFYLDINELFDDENGNLSVEYTVDESHVLGKYYADWVEWLLKHAITTAN